MRSAKPTRTRTLSHAGPAARSAKPTRARPSPTAVAPSRRGGRFGSVGSESVVALDGDRFARCARIGIGARKFAWRAFRSFMRWGVVRSARVHHMQMHSRGYWSRTPARSMHTYAGSHATCPIKSMVRRYSVRRFRGLQGMVVGRGSLKTVLIAVRAGGWAWQLLAAADRFAPCWARGGCAVCTFL